jgi:apolipoprotein N-acyltransferase
MRALETGRMLLTVANTGISAVIGADGAVLGRLPQFAESRLDTSAQGRTGLTPYVAFADGPALALCLLLVFFAWRARSR